MFKLCDILIMHEKLTLDRVTPPKSETNVDPIAHTHCNSKQEFNQNAGCSWRGGVVAGNAMLLITGLRSWSFAFFNLGLLVTKGQGEGILVRILFFTTMAVSNYADRKVSQMGTYGNFHAT